MPYVFGDYVLHAPRRELSHRGRAVPLRPQVFDLLVYLVTHHDRVVSKQELHANLWVNVHVSPATLSAAIKRARQAVGDSGAGQQVIQTLHGRGYRFVAPVEEREAPSPTARPATEPALGMEMPASRLPGMRSTPAPDGAGLAGPGEAGELKPVSVLCGALADGPALAATLGPEGLYRLLQMVRQATRAVMQQYAGTLIPQAIGEGFTAVFGAPLAQEDHSRRAVLAALDLRERLRQSPGEPAPVLSMGIHSSVVVVGDPGPDPSDLMMVVGPAFQGAMQLQRQAAPGALLVSAPAYHAVQDDVGGEVCGSLGPGRGARTHGGVRRAGPGVAPHGCAGALAPPPESVRGTATGAGIAPRPLDRRPVRRRAGDQLAGGARDRQDAVADRVRPQRDARRGDVVRGPVSRVRSGGTVPDRARVPPAGLRGRRG